MSITNIQTLHDLAETALASYANLEVGGNLLVRLQQDGIGATFTSDQAKTFTDHYTLLSVQANIDWNGFSAAVFQDKLTGEKVIAMRGTEFDRGINNIGTDLGVADALGIGASGYANLQGVEMYRYWKKLTTVGGQSVYYSDSELMTLFALKLGPVAGAVVLTTPVGQAAGLAGFLAFKAGFADDKGIDTGVAGQSVIAAGEKVNVTGHSLGGHLALLFARLFPESVDEVVTLNAPTFFSHGDIFLNALGFPNSVNAKITRLEADGDGVSELGNVDPGTAIRIAQENAPGPAAAISTNHSSVNSVDGLALMAVLAKLDTSKADDAVYFSNLIRASANTVTPSYENLLDALRKALAGPNVVPLPTGSASDLSSRTVFYATLDALQKNPIFQGLIGKLRIEPPPTSIATLARYDFGAFIALQDLSPLYISGTTAGARDQLAEIWQAGRATDYAAWQADKSATTPSSFTDQWLADRAALLQAITIRNQKDETSGTLSTDTAPTDRNLQFQWYGANPLPGETLPGLATLLETKTYYADRPVQRIAFGDDGANALIGTDSTLGDHLYGGGGSDTLNGLKGDDYLEGNSGDDTLIGGAGNDTLLGGSDTDNYQFGGTWGKDTIIDSDGQGQITIDGDPIGAVQGTGGHWAFKTTAGVQYDLALLTDSRSNTGYKLQIAKKGDATNSITINHFDAGAAINGNGYLGMQLGKIEVAVVATGSIPSSDGPSFWSKLGATLNDLVGKSAEVAEGAGRSFTVYLSQAAKLGDTITLALNGLADKFKAQIGGSTVDANGAVITLTQGQTSVSFALVQQGATSTDASTALSATYQGGGQSAASNSFGIQLKDAGEVVKTFRGDQHGAIDTTHSTSAYYDWSGTSWAVDGTLVNGVEEAGYGDVIIGSADQDQILGLGGNDALDGMAGNDQIDGGDGNDLIAGGMGADNIKGGAGDDTIFSDASLRNWDGTALRQHTYVQPNGTPDDWKLPQSWNGQWSLPVGATVVADGGTWGTYELNGVRGTSAYYDVGLDVASDVVDAGDGKDYVRTGAGDDRIQGGAGDDVLYAAAGSDVVEGGTGDDKLYGDEAGVSEDKHGNDFLDGGDGTDLLIGGGRDDVLYGGSGADTLRGDGTVDVQYSGNDYLDGEDGNDQLEGGAKDDILYGGAGDDTLRGDAWYDPQYDGADYLDGEDGKDTLIGGGKDDTLYGGAGDDALYGDGTTDDAHYSGADYLDGEAGKDTLVGGGKDDTLFGGAGDDALYGDNSTDMLAGALHGNDYLDGEDGDDLVQGDGGNDTIYGGAGNDTLWGDALATRVGAQFHGADSIDGGDGNDDITGDGGADTLLGGAGDDRITGDSSLRDSNDAGYLDAQYHGDDFIDGGEGNDRLWGDGGNDAIYGGAGNDTLYGDAGSDYLDGGEGDDTLVAGAGDTVVDESGTNTLTLVDGASEGVHADGADLLFDYGASGVLRVVNALTGSVVRIDGLATEDWLKGNLLDEVKLTTTRAHQKLIGGSGNDRLTAHHENSTLLGGEGADTLVGSFGDDQLHGGAGNDVVDGGAGDDVLFADAGRDVLRGGAGLDTYVLGRSTGQATVQDDSADGSVIRLDDSGLSFDNLQASRLQNDLLVSVRGTATSMRIEGYFSQLQPNFLIADSAQNTMTVEALLESSKPSWDGLVNSLRQDYKLYARSVVGASAFAQGMTLQADGSWQWTSSYKGSNVSNSLDNITYDRQIVHLDLNTSQSWTTTSTEQVTNVWGTPSWELMERSGTALTANFSEINQTWSMDGDYVRSRSQELSGYTTWAFTDWKQGQVLTLASDWYDTGDYWWTPGLGADTPGATEYRQTYEKYSTVRVEYQGIIGEETLVAPGGQDLSGPLPAFIPVSYDHYIDSYNLGQTFVPNGTYLIYADRTADVELTVGDSTVFGGGFVYGGTGNSTMSSGHTLVAGTGDQRLEYGQLMVVGDGHNTVIGNADSSIYVDPNNVGMDLIANGSYNDSAVLEKIYASQGVTNWAERYQYGGMLYVSILEGYDGYFNSIDEARSAVNANLSWTTFDDAMARGYVSVSQVAVLPFLPSLYNMEALAGMSASAYYNSHSTPVVALGATEFAALQPYIDAGVLSTPTVHFGPGLSLADIQFSWGEALSPVNGKLHITLNLQWGQDQGVRVLIPGVSDPLNSAIQRFEFADGSVVNITNLIALAPPKVFNRAPTLGDAIGEQDIVQGQLFNFGVAGIVFMDPDSDDVLSYSAILTNGEPLPVWLSFDTETGIFSGTPGNDDVGALELMISASDRFGESVTASFNMTVTNVNDAPIVAMVAADLVCQQAEALSLQIDANLFADIDVDDSLQWSLSLADGNPLPNWLSFDAATKMLLGTPQFEDAGVLSLQVTATDTLGAATSQTFTLTVNETVGLQVTGTAASDILFGGSGSDHLEGGLGDDTYRLGLGYGADSVQENDATAGNTDIALFDAGISADQLWFRQVGNNLDVSIIGTSDKFTLGNWYLGNQYHVEQFKTSDGKMLLDSQVQNLVSAMAAFSPPAAGQTTLPANYASSLSPVIAANWQ